MMAWLKLDDGFVEHPRIEPLTDRAFRLHVAALCQCARKLTDGHISLKDARMLSVLTRSRARHIDELVDKGLWNVNGNGWVLRDFLDYNPSAEHVKTERKKAAERMAKARNHGGKR
jgi:hypothetical protein